MSLIKNEHRRLYTNCTRCKVVKLSQSTRINVVLTNTIPHTHKFGKFVVDVVYVLV